MTIKGDFDTFIDGITSAITDNVLNSNLPLVGNDLNSVASSVLQFLTELKAHVDEVLEPISAGSAAQDIVNAFTTANISGVTANLDPSDNSKVVLNFAETPDAINATLTSQSLDFGGTGVGLDATAAIKAIIQPALNLSLSLDPSNGEFSLADTGTPQVSVDVGIATDISDGSGGPAEANLGPIAVKVTDNVDYNTPEINLNVGLDFQSFDPSTVKVTIGGGVNVDLGLETDVLNGVLPTIFTDLLIKYDFSNDGFGDATVKFGDVSVGLGSLLNDLLHTIQPVLDIFNAYPFKEIIHTLIDPLPIIGDVPKLLPFLHLDPIPSPDGDGVLNFLDLAAAVDPNDRDTISKFAQALPIIEQLANLDASAAGDQKIDLGDLNLTGGLTSFTNAAANPLDQLNAFLANTPGIVSDVLGAVQDVANALDPNPLKTAGVAAAGGLTFPIFDDPSKLVNILLPSLGDGKPVQFIEYTLPDLSYHAHMDEFFPIIGPFGLSLSGDFAAALTLSIGYDSFGLTLPSPDLIDGIFLSTPEVDALHPMPDGLPPSPNGHLPVGYISAAIHGGVGVGLVVAEADVEGGFSGDVETYFPNGELRWTTISEGCFFDPFSGELNADVALRITVGFGIFSWTHRIVFAEATLADFSADCGGGIGVEDPGGALAMPNPDILNGPDLLLNVGDRAGLRLIGGQAGTDGDEVFAIANATVSTDALQDPTPLPGTLAVNAFGITENFGSADHPMATITANFGNGNDSLAVAPDVTQALFIHGNAGDDRLYAGAGDATLYGDAGDDTLIGGTGNDHLYGGADNDYLEGGKGGDYIDGGDGFDQVTYENSAFGVIFHPTTINGQSGFIGSGPAGSDAVGDTLVSIEYIIGSHYDDQLYADPSQGSTLEGLEGNDALTGGNGNDFLLGGPGADAMVGGNGEDGTSYLTSWDGVQVDLTSHHAHGGDAEGDTLYSIEDVQGTNFDDVLTGDGSRNVLDGWNGDDIIDGRGGGDVITGGAGNDIIYGGADGDILDGGPGIDLLTYVNVSHSVSVNLHNRTGSNGDKMGDVDNHNQFLNLADADGYSSFENLTGSYYSDSLTGDLGYNTIRGLDGNDAINGDGGNDILVGGKGADQLDGGNGIDTASYEDSFGGVFVSLQPPAPLFPGYGLYNDAAGDTLTNVENLLGSLWADTLIGDDNDNVINPYLSLSGLLPVPGAATAGVGTAIDYVDGGQGTDTMVIDYSLDDVGQGVTGGYNYGSSDTGAFLRMDNSGTVALDGVSYTSIEQLSVIGTIQDDTIYAGAGNDFVATGGGNDTIFAGLGSDEILAQEGNDSVYYGTDQYQQLSPFGGDNSDLSTQAVFYLDGGRGIDSLSISLGAVDYDVSLVGHDPNTEFNGVNLELSNGSAITNFEVLQDVTTGGGDDYVEQPGNVDNHINTGWGEDIIVPGLGVDSVDGGGDFFAGREVEWEPLFAGSFFGNVPVVTDRDAFNANSGDLLVLDYSSFSGPGGIIGQVTSHNSNYQVYQDNGNGLFVLPITTNQGSYSGGSRGDANHTAVSFDEIERLYVTGSDQDDLIVGTFGVATFSAAYSNGTARGADILNGADGNDLLIGNGGSDILLGGAGNDILIGTDPTMPTATNYYQDGGIHFYATSAGSNPDQVEFDTLVGGAGADTFVLGNAQGYFYGNIENFYGSFFGNYADNHAIITDFNPDDGDVIQLNGNSLKYSIATQDGPDGHTETLLYADFGSSPDLIAEIYNFSLTDLTASYIHYVGGPNGDGVEVAAEQHILDEASGVSNALTPQFSPGFATSFGESPGWVTQDNNPAELLAAMFGGPTPSGIVSLGDPQLIGDGRAFGTFSGDPFGLGSGIVLSTGVATDLNEPNTNDGGSSAPTVEPITFQFIGRVGNSDIVRADLSNLSIDELKSILLQDDNSHQGGSGGGASGFDLDAIVLSSTYLDSVDGMTVDQLNDGITLPRLNVFDFTAAGMEYQAGTERDGGTQAANLYGTINSQLINAGEATLNTFDGVLSGPGGFFSLGDGGSVKFSLTQPVSTSGPLYLYLAEDGGSGESVDGLLAVSDTGRQVPTTMSTDFGAPGPANDDISFTWHFTTAPGSDVTQIAFQFALFSEELTEFAGSEFNDSFKILLNGVNLAHLSNGSAATINNLMSSPHVQLTDDLILNPANTGPVADLTATDSYTKVLDYVGSINPGQDNVLTIEVTDVRDGFLDSGILVKAGTFEGGSGNGSGFGNGNITADAGSIANGTPAEVFEGSGPIFIPVTIDPGSLGDLTAPVTIDFSADSQLDFGNGAGVPFSFSHTFNPGDDPFVFNLAVSAPDDHVAEGPRFDAINLEVHSSDSTFDGMAVAPIVVEIDDAQSHLSINDVSHVEGDLGSSIFEFTVTRTGGTSALSVDFVTADGTATTASGDYSALGGTLSFAAGEMTKTIDIGVNGDISFEGNETFSVNLNNANGATIDDGQGVGTIVNDDSASGDTSGISANTTVSLAASGGFYVSTPTGHVTLSGSVNDFVTGSGNDTITGNNNGDVLNGNAGNDTVRGGSGNDNITGGDGTDRLTGGAGNDTFVFRANFGHDTITDFTVGTAAQHDTLDLRGLGFADANDVLNHTDNLASAVIHVGADDITLQNVSKTALAGHLFDLQV